MASGAQVRATWNVWKMALWPEMGKASTGFFTSACLAGAGLSEQPVVMSARRVSEVAVSNFRSISGWVPSNMIVDCAPAALDHQNRVYTTLTSSFTRLEGAAMNRTYWSAALLALALGVCTDTALFARTSGGGTGGGGSTGGGRTPAPTRPTQPSTGPWMTGGDRQPAMMDIQRPIFLTTVVVMDDGNPPPEPVVMMLVCNGQPRPQGYSDMKGRFSVTLGQNNIVMPDASISGPNDTFGSNSTRSVQTGPTSGGMSERQLMGCEFRADLPGFRSDVLQLSGRRLMDNPQRLVL